MRRASSGFVMGGVLLAASSLAPNVTLAEDAGGPRGGPPGACAVDLPSPVAKVEDVSDAVIARAMIPSLEPASMKAKVTNARVADCRGGSVSAVVEVENARGDVKKSPGGKVAVWKRESGIGDARQAVWLVTATHSDDGRMGAPICPASEGLFGIVELQGGSRVTVLGFAPWSDFCAVRGVRAERLSGEPVVVVSSASDPGASGWEEVWTLHSGKLETRGSYNLWMTSPPPDAIRYVGDSIVLWGYDEEREGSSRPWARRYTLRDGKIVDAPLPPEVPKGR